MSEYTSMRVKKSVKAKMLELDFVKRQSENEIVDYLVDFYQKNYKKVAKK